MDKTIHVLGFSGSLRRASYNTALLRAAQTALPEGMLLDTFDLTPIPMYNADLRQQGLPSSVKRFRAMLSAADAVLIATPEYNFSVPGVLKNALDWASISPDPPLRGKTAAIMGATTGQFGTVRAQMHLRDILMHENMLVVNRPQMLVAHAREKFDEQGNLTDEATRAFLHELLESLAALTLQLRRTQLETAETR